MGGIGTFEEVAGAGDGQVLPGTQVLALELALKCPLKKSSGPRPICAG